MSRIANGLQDKPGCALGGIRVLENWRGLLIRCRRLDSVVVVKSALVLVDEDTAVSQRMAAVAVKLFRRQTLAGAERIGQSTIITSNISRQRLTPQPVLKEQCHADRQKTSPLSENNPWRRRRLSCQFQPLQFFEIIITAQFAELPRRLRR